MLSSQLRVRASDPAHPAALGAASPCALPASEAPAEDGAREGGGGSVASLVGAGSPGIRHIFSCGTQRIPLLSKCHTTRTCTLSECVIRHGLGLVLDLAADCFCTKL